MQLFDPDREQVVLAAAEWLALIDQNPQCLEEVQLAQCFVEGLLLMLTMTQQLWRLDPGDLDS